MKKTFLFSCISIFIFTNLLTLNSQETSGKLFRGLPEGLTISGYTDIYIAYDNDKNVSPRSLSSIAPYRDEFRLNLAQISAKYANEKIRAAITLQYGDVPRLNWPSDNQFIQEANIGFSPSKNLWIDAGYFLTHIGGEGVIPKYNFFQSFALCTYYEPLFQAGVKLSYTGKKFYCGLHLLNGFNVLSDNNKNKSFGITLGYKPNDKMDFTYNNIIGNEQPYSFPGKTRFYNNLILKFYPHKKIDVILCGDLCYQEKSKIKDTTEAATMFSAFASVRFHATKNFSISARGEILQDKNGFMTGRFIDTDSTLTGLKVFGITGGMEFNPVSNAYIRLETRYLAADTKQKIFFENSNSKVEVILSSGLEF
ncbi:MAG TPA: outer membrane beta-barrel protein [Ignavibacteria bacterium]|jgi:hypothetical protein